jgi:hypothetical protein
VFGKEVGNLYSRYDRAAWQSPEALLAGLRSPEETTRLEALHLLGAVGRDAYVLLHNKEADTE